LTVLASSFVIIPPPGDQDIDFEADVVLASLEV
jgi:hypothetical protein